MISIVKGVEFANILAMVAVIDELVEFSMRKKCAMLAWKFPNDV
jgi:NifU-like protein involved in Fe-S cluster formation